MNRANKIGLALMMLAIFFSIVNPDPNPAWLYQARGISVTIGALMLVLGGRDGRS